MREVVYMDDFTQTSIFTDYYTLEMRDVDFNRDLKLSALFSLMQEAAISGSNALGIGVETIQTVHNVTWVLLKINVIINRMPKLHERLKIETWLQEPKALLFDRDFLIFDEKDEIIVQATSIWGIIDLSTRMIKRSRTIAINYPNVRTKRAHYIPFQIIKAEREIELAYRRVIGYSDIDFNGHLNNSKYIEFIMDCFTVENHKQYEVAEIEVHFINELLPGDNIALYRDISQLDKHTIYIEGQREIDNIAFKALVIIRTKI